MDMSIRQKVRRWARRSWPSAKKWFEDYGVALLVFVALAGAVAIGLHGKVPDPVPDYALQSMSLYRVLVIGIAFVVFSVIIGVFVMGLNGWVITHVGPRGIKGGRVVKSNARQQVPLRRHEQAIKGLDRGVERNTTATLILQRQIRGQARELEELTRWLSAAERSRDELRRRVEELERDGSR